VKPSAFDYRCPDSLEEALALLAQYGDDAKIIAGGQSLMPMMNFRVVRPTMVIDIGRLLELDKIETNADRDLRIGAITRHRTLESSPLVRRCFPIIPEAMGHVAHLAIRNRGTIGGSLTHADPAAELPMLVRLLDGQIFVRSVRGARQIAATDFFISPLTTALSSDEILVRVDLPGLPHHLSAFEEFSRRSGDLQSRQLASY
jgi:carbon-monoxide dehydrogenase medium subunit